MSNSVRSRSLLTECFLLGEEGLDRNSELAGDSLQERYFGGARIEWRYGAEAECPEPVIAHREGNE
jgi:hypothetical protein